MACDINEQLREMPTFEFVQKLNKETNTNIGMQFGQLKEIL